MPKDVEEFLRHVYKDYEKFKNQQVNKKAKFLINELSREGLNAIEKLATMLDRSEDKQKSFEFLDLILLFAISRNYVLQQVSNMELVGWAMYSAMKGVELSEALRYIT